MCVRLATRLVVNCRVVDRTNTDKCSKAYIKKSVFLRLINELIAGSSSRLFEMLNKFKPW